jgi:hypothetical protein
VKAEDLSNEASLSKERVSKKRKNLLTRQAGGTKHRRPSTENATQVTESKRSRSKNETKFLTRRKSECRVRAPQAADAGDGETASVLEN